MHYLYNTSGYTHIFTLYSGTVPSSDVIDKYRDLKCVWCLVISLAFLFFGFIGCSYLAISFGRGKWPVGWFESVSLIFC